MLARSGMGRKLLIVTDAWHPQVNGVVQTYRWLQRELLQLDIEVTLLTPDGFRTVAMPTYPEIRLALTSRRHIGARIESLQPDNIHIATEGPLGWHARGHCLALGRSFSSCYHTRYPEYIAARLPLPIWPVYQVLKRFHNASAATLVATEELGHELQARGFSNVQYWRRGVDVDLFRSGPVAQLDLPRPYFLFVGRIAVEKNIDAFLQLDLPGSKILVGDGPARHALQGAFPEAVFLGEKHAEELASIYRVADVFVFPSKTDTFGLVMAEALAAGTPVAAYPGAGVQAIFGGAACGAMDQDLRQAALAALEADREVCRAAGARHSMRASAESFLQLVAPPAREPVAGMALDHVLALRYSHSPFHGNGE